jgi:hypothetical protein
LVERGFVPTQFAKDGNDMALAIWLESEMASRDLKDKQAVKEYLASSVRDTEFGVKYSLLHLAALRAKESVLYCLVDNEWIDPNITDRNGNTALHLCAEKGNPVCAKILLDVGHANADFQNRAGKTALHVAAENEQFEVIKTLVKGSVCDKSMLDADGNTPLHIAVHKQDYEVARYLIVNAAAPHILDKDGKTPLDYLSLRHASYFKSIAQLNDAFISYAHVDLKFAKKLKENLEKHAIKCWMDLTRLEAGNDWRLDIGNGLLASRLVVFIIARASVVSDWCMKELHMARKAGIPIIPIVQQKVDVDAEVESFIFGKKLIDFTDEKKFESAGDELSDLLKDVLHTTKVSAKNKYNTVPTLKIEKMWELNFLSIMIEAYQYIDEGYHLEAALHRSGIFTYTHSLLDKVQSEHMDKNTNMCWGFIFLIKNVKQCEATIQKWQDFAHQRQKRVYFCMMSNSANQAADMALLKQQKRDDVLPLFYLQDKTSVKQLVYFIHLHQREVFLEKNVQTLETKLTTVTEGIKTLDEELTALRKRFVVD